MTRAARAARWLLIAIGAGIFAVAPDPAFGQSGSAGHGAPKPARLENVSAFQTTASLVQRLSARPRLRFARGTPSTARPVVTVDDTTRYQQFIGAGGAMTDSSAWLLWNQLAPSQRSDAMRELFGRSGLRLSFVRVPMGASDYSATGSPYTYDDMPAEASDPGLAGFSIAHDQTYILPALQAAKALNPSLFVEALPWSPPGWMKANDALDNTAHAGTLLPSAYGWLAAYFVKFLDAYAAAGVPVNAVSPQNEPGVAAVYPGLQLNQLQEAEFVSAYLLPALRLAGLSPSVFGWDLSWGRLPASSPLVEATYDGLTGLAWHCYFGRPSAMSLAHRENPAMIQLVDECSTSQAQTEPTAEMLIASLRNWANAFSTWNLALDPDGKPVEPPDTGCVECTGLITVDAHTGAAVPTRDYFEIGQLSRFVMPGAVRIASPHFVSYALSSARHLDATPGLDDVAFFNPDRSKVLILFNTASRWVSFQVRWRGDHLADRLPAGAMLTLTWR